MLLIMKNKNIVIVLAVVVILAVLGGGYFLFAKKSSSSSKNQTQQTQDSMNAQTLDPDAIGLSLSATPGNKKIQFKISKLSGITAIEYELTYQANATAQEKAEGSDAQVQRGITGDAKINSGDSSYSSPSLDLGTCSSGTCHYDTGVTSVDLVLKVTKDGKVYQVEKKLDLSQ